jgi:hypothetical protein
LWLHELHPQRSILSVLQVKLSIIYIGINSLTILFNTNAFHFQTFTLNNTKYFENNCYFACAHQKAIYLCTRFRGQFYCLSKEQKTRVKKVFEIFSNKLLQE